jgi:hypothetical protein
MFSLDNEIVLTFFSRNRTLPATASDKPSPVCQSDATLGQTPIFTPLFQNARPSSDDGSIRTGRWIAPRLYIRRPHPFSSFSVFRLNYMAFGELFGLTIDHYKTDNVDSP